jgi:signal transduction histidine kinase
MREVSCRVLDVHFRELQKKGLPAGVLLDGVPYSLAHLQNKHERIDWASFVRLMANLRKIWSEDEIIAQGGAWIESPFLRHTTLVVGALFTPKQFYQWLANDSKSGRRGGGMQVHTCTTTSFDDHGPDRLSLEVRIDEGHAPCPEFFLLCKGGFQAVPRLVGKEQASVVLTPIDRGMRFDIRLPPGSDRVSRLHRAIRWITSSAAVATELDDAHTTLQVRHEELARARTKLAVQAAQLRTAHTVSGLIQKDLDLDLVLEAIAKALVNEAGFTRARVDLDVEIDGISIVRSIQRGEGGSTCLERELEGRGGTRRTGKLTVFADPKADTAELDELLAFIVPSIAMAIDNALSYRVVEEYRRGLEVRVAERTAELQQARDDLTQTVRSLEDAKEVRDRIFANINHDIRSPLSLVLLSVDEARSRPANELTPDGLRTLAAIEHGARRVLRMVDELLILAEGRESNVRVWTTHFDLGALVANIAEAWKPAARAAGLTLESRVQTDLVARVDPNAVERILANLLSNAIKFTPKGGTIGLEASAGGAPGKRHAALVVRDNGPGIPAALRTNLFGRFERAAPLSSAAISGSGLGLSLVKELTEAHGGSVLALDADGGGAIFRVELPLPEGVEDETLTNIRPSLRPADYGALSNEPRVPPAIYEAASTARATILLAEDDPDLRERTARLLSTEYRVLTAPDGISALALARTHAPDLLVTDVAMPGIDGIELTRRFRALPGTRLAPVLVLTTFGRIGDRLAGFDAGAVDYIHKPFEPAELHARIRSQLALRTLALQLLESEKLAALGTLSAGLAHEIRNPANGIINAVGPLRSLLPPEAVLPDTPTAQLLDVIEHCSRQVATLSRELLGFKRGVEVERTPVPIESLVRRVTGSMRHALRGVEVRIELGYRGTIFCAEPLFAQVLTNLLQNAAQSAGKGGWVELRTSAEEHRIAVEVIDSGPGVPDELRERIFEPFFTTKPAGQGTGLGLSTAREITLRHNGTLTVRRAGDRSVFRVELPVEQASTNVARAGSVGTDRVVSAESAPPPFEGSR